MVFPAISRRHVVRYFGMTADIIRMAGKMRFFAEDQIALLNEKFAGYIGSKRALAVSSGRVSLEAILRALEFEKGREIILPAYTYHSVPEAICHLGLRPVFVDIDETDNNIDPEKIKEKIGPNTAAVLATHIFGHPCRIDEIADVCRENDLVLLEDCAHSLGAKYKGKKVGTFGRAAFFSFGATKVFNTFGGGMVVTDDTDLADKVEKVLGAFADPKQSAILKPALVFSALHFFTRRLPFTFFLYPAMLAMELLKLDIIGLYNKTFKRTAESISVPVRYSNLQAALALRQLETIDAKNALRRKNAETLDALLRPEIKRLRPVPDADSVWYFFAVGSKQRDEIASKLLRMGIDTGKYIMDDCAELAGVSEPFAVTAWWRKNSLQIPIHLPLTENDMIALAKAVNQTVPAP